jgi:hypothetical protein
MEQERRENEKGENIMSSILNAWSVSGAAIGALASLASSAFTKSVSGEGAAAVSVGAIFVCGGLGLAAESIYHKVTEPNSAATTSSECVKNAPQGYTITVGKDGACSYAPK